MTALRSILLPGCRCGCPPCRCRGGEPATPKRCWS